MKLRTVKNIMDGSLLAFVAVTLVFYLLPDNALGWYVAFAVIFLIAYLVFMNRFWRCPCCGKFLGRNEGEFCQHCGGQLYDE